MPLRACFEKCALRQDADQFIRSARLLFNFRNQKTPEPTPKVSWPSFSPSIDVIPNVHHPLASPRFELYTNHTNLNQSTCSNFTGEWKALASPRRRQDIIIKFADKSRAVVVWNIEHYIKESHMQLQTPVFIQNADTILPSPTTCS